MLWYNHCAEITFIYMLVCLPTGSTVSFSKNNWVLCKFIWTQDKILLCMGGYRRHSNFGSLTIFNGKSSNGNNPPSRQGYGCKAWCEVAWWGRQAEVLFSVLCFFWCSPKVNKRCVCVCAIHSPWSSKINLLVFI